MLNNAKLTELKLKLNPDEEENVSSRSSLLLLSLKKRAELKDAAAAIKHPQPTTQT